MPLTRAVAVMCLSIITALLPLRAIAATTLYVEDYGAIANDGVNDAAAISAALAAAGPGDTVMLGSGTYNVSSTLAPKPNTILAGAGLGTTTLLGSYSSSANGMIQLGSRNDIRSNIEMYGFTLDGNVSTNCLSGIQGGGGTGYNIHDMAVRNLNTKADGSGIVTGVYFWLGGNDIAVDNCQFSNIGTGNNWGGAIRAEANNNPAHDITISNNVITNMGRGGIFTNGANDLIVRGNTVTGSGLGGSRAISCELWHGSSWIVEDNNFDHFLSCISMTNSAVRRNTIAADDGKYEGCAFEDVGVNAGNVIADNYFGRGNYLGVSLGYEVEYNLFVGNTFDANDTWGIQMQGDSNHVSRHLYFYRNTFSSANEDPPNTGADYGTAVRFNGGTEYVVFDSNTVVNNDGTGFNTTGNLGVNYIEFINNTIANNQDYAFWIGSPSVTDLNISGNTVYGNGNNSVPASKGFAGNDAPEIAMVAPAIGQVGVPIDFGFLFADDGYAEYALWDFDTGLPVAEMTPQFTFDEAGEYRITLVVWDDGGRAAVDQVTLSIVAVLLGDANNDGVVSADDFAAVQTNFGNTGAADGLLLGDANDDGVVSADDFAAIQANFGSATGASAHTDGIPEPATMMVLALGSVALVGGMK